MHPPQQSTSSNSSRLGAFGISFGLPILCFVFAFFVNDTSGCPPPSLLQPKTFSLDKLKDDVGWQGFSSLINAQAFAATIGYYLFSLTLNAVLPATKVDGIELRSGGRLTYRFNGGLRHHDDCRIWLTLPFLQPSYPPL